MGGKKRRRRGVPVWVWLAGGGGALALVLVVVLVIVLGRGPAGTGMPGGGLPGGAKKPAWNDFVKIRQGMTADQVLEVLGPPVESREEREGTVMTWEARMGGDYIELTFRDGRLKEGWGFFGGGRHGINQ
jgi:hypothetical protein